MDIKIIKKILYEKLDELFAFYEKNEIEAKSKSRGGTRSEKKRK